jgi:hypothetical protein
MNQHSSPSTDQHRQIFLLLPWYLNKSLEQDELQQVESHLRNCIVCHRELVALRKLAAAVKQSSDLDAAAEASFAKLREKLQTADPLRKKPLPSNNQPRLVWSRKPAAATPGLSVNTANRYSRLLSLRGSSVTHFAIAASMLLAIIPLVMQYGRSPATTDYYTLSAAKPESQSGTKLRIVFSKSLPNAGIDLLLEKIHGQLVEGPNSVGAYTVRLGADKNSQDLTAAVALLRNQQNVLLVEPVIEP